MTNIIIFDLDGTLVDSAKNITDAVNHTRGYFSLAPISKGVVIETINREDVNTAFMFYGTQSFTQEQKDIFEEFYLQSCASGLSFFDGAVETLQALKSQNYKLSVATNGATVFAKKMLEALDAFDYFDFVLGYDSVKQPKPSPDMLHSILDAYGADNSARSKALMVGDSIKDIKAANAAGIRSAFASWGYTAEKIEADIFLGSLSDMIEIL